MSSVNLRSKKLEKPDGGKPKCKSETCTQKCALCKFETPLKGRLAAHVNSHSVGVSAFTCPQEGCYYRAMSKTTLKRHLLRHVPNRKKDIQCPICPKLYYTRREMLFHIKAAHARERAFQCEMCEYRAQTRNCLNFHRQTQHSLQSLHLQKNPAKLNKCETCDYKTWYSSRFRRHLICHTDAKPFKCNFPDCNFSTKTKDGLEMHERGHDPGKALHCEYPACTFTTGHKWVLKCHVEAHSTEKIYSCSFPGCPHRAKVLRAMKAHERTVHNPGRQRNFQCALCEKSFGTLSNLKIHTRAHTKEKHLTCPLCSLSLAKKGELYLHLVRKHEKILVEDPSTLQRHNVQVSEGADTKRLMCELPNCDYKGWSQRDLKIHKESVHLGLRPFQCSFKDCTKTYKLKKVLTEHERNHDPSSFKVHKCPQCKDKSFFKPCEVKKHMLRVHKGDNPYKCRHCGHVSLSKEDVIKHSESGHHSGLCSQMKAATVVIQRIRLLHF